MNKSTYKAIDAAAKAIRAFNLDELTNLSHLQDLLDEARNDYDDKSESWQVSDKGMEEMARIDALESFVNAMESAIESLRDASSQLEEIENNAPEGAFN